MIVLANFLSGIGHVLDLLINFVMILVLIRAVVSWANPDPSSAFVRFLWSATEPFLAPLRRFIPSFGGLDLTPLALFAALIFLQTFLVGSLYGYARQIALQ